MLGGCSEVLGGCSEVVDGGDRTRAEFVEIRRELTSEMVPS